MYKGKKMITVLPVGLPYRRLPSSDSCVMSVVDFFALGKERGPVARESGTTRVEERFELGR